MFPTSNKTGTAVIAFPDVCTTPAQPAPLPLPYPGVNYDWRASQTQTQTKAPPTGPVGQKISGRSFVAARGVEAGTLKEMVSFNTRGPTTVVAAGAAIDSSLRSHLSRLHNDMMIMRADKPELWHAAIDNYVRLVAELYKARASS